MVFPKPFAPASGNRKSPRAWRLLRFGGDFGRKIMVDVTRNLRESLKSNWGKCMKKLIPLYSFSKFKQLNGPHLGTDAWIEITHVHMCFFVLRRFSMVNGVVTHSSCDIMRLPDCLKHLTKFLMLNKFPKPARVCLHLY